MSKDDHTDATRASAEQRAASEDLRSTAEDLIVDANRLEEIERRKLQLEPGDAEIDRLSHESDEIGRRIKSKTAAERALAQRLSASDR